MYCFIEMDLATPSCTMQEQGFLSSCDLHQITFIYKLENLTRIPRRYTGWANMNFYVKTFESYHLTNTTKILYTTPFRAQYIINTH